ncbi:MAG: hypothetical protein QXZ22_09280 [Sulfolobales archaeon]
MNYVEAAVWTTGCNPRCTQSRNHHVAYDNTSTREEAVHLAVACHGRYRTKA